MTPILRWFAVTAVVLAGCDRPAPPPAARPTVPPGPCAVVGCIYYGGPRPETDAPAADCCPGVPRPPDESVAVNADAALRDVIVYVKAGPNVAGPPPATQVVLAQRGCRYVPHVFAVRAGQTVVVTNGDPTDHNVHYESVANGRGNFPEIAGGSRAIPFPAADDAVTFKCDVHPWMRAHAMVFDHPCYAVTADDGTFRLDRLPPGTYTVVAHQERFGDLEQQVTVTAERPRVQVRFDYKP